MRAYLIPAALLALAACHEAAPAPEGRPPPPPVAEGVTASLVVSDGSGAAGPFRLDDLARLAIEARYGSAERGPHAVRIDVVAPEGTLYAQLRGSLEVGAHGVGVSSHALEVHGTPIESFRQVGRWRFSLSVDGGAPLATAVVDVTE